MDAGHFYVVATVAQFTCVCRLRTATLVWLLWATGRFRQSRLPTLLSMASISSFAPDRRNFTMAVCLPSARLRPRFSPRPHLRCLISKVRSGLLRPKPSGPLSVASGALFCRGLWQRLRCARGGRFHGSGDRGLARRWRLRRLTGAVPNKGWSGAGSESRPKRATAQRRGGVWSTWSGSCCRTRLASFPMSFAFCPDAGFSSRASLWP